MAFLQYTSQWVKGEILEATVVAIAGFLFIASGLLFWRFGHTPGARALIIPLLIIGAIHFTMGVSGVATNARRMNHYQEKIKKDPSQFVENEKERVEGFDAIFKVTFPVATLAIIGGAAMFLFLGGVRPKAIGLSLILLGLSTYTVDFFAKERADIYYQHILEASRDH